MNPDRSLLRRAALSVAVLAAAAVAVVVAVVATLTYFLAGHEFVKDARTTVHDAAVSADDTTDPPAGVVLLEQPPGASTTYSPNVPAGLHLSVRGLRTGASRVTAGPRTYEAYVEQRGDGTRFAALADLGARTADQRRLLGPVLLAGVAGILGAAAVGGLIGARATLPLGRALALQRRFVADASHELRTPLTVLHTRAQLLEHQLADDTDPRRRAHELVADTRALSEVVEDLLLSAELEHRPERSEPVDLAALAADVTRAFAPYADAAGVNLCLQAPDDPPTLFVAGVPAALRRALSSLVDNALAHEHPGGTVTITALQANGSAQLVVADDGDGLDPRTADQLLRRFVRAGGDAGHGRRFGLGLALVNEVVHTHHGSIDIDGRPGEGARFTLTFPLAGQT